MLTLLYGSQTGTAEAFARTLEQEGKPAGFRCTVKDLLDYDPRDLPGEECVVFVVATYGEGDPVDAARDFYDWLRAQTVDTCDLTRVKFAIFGLGDRQYKHFNQCGKETEKLLKLCGATALYPRGEGDADKAIEDDFDDWKADLWPALAAHFGIPYVAGDRFDCERTAALHYDPTAPVGPVFPVNRRVEVGPRNPVWAPVIGNRELLPAPGDRSTRHVELDITGLGLHYEAGDHLGVFGCNPDAVVDEYLSVIADQSPLPFTLKPLKATASGGNPLPSRCTLRQALQWYLDLTYPPKRSVLKAFSQYTADEAEQAHFRSYLRNDPESKAEFRKLCDKLRNTYGWLRKFRSTRVPADVFVEFMPRMQPRFYSIASDPLAHPAAVHLCAAVEPAGLVSPFLRDQPVGAQVPIFVRRSTFHYPRAPTTPVILIGPGTGIAPLIGFLQRRRALRAAGEPLAACHLFFGCRRRTEDFLYDEFLEQCEADGTLTALHVAFSREQEEKVYVQHLLARHGPMVWECLQNGGRIYVCGDARGMAHGVETTLKALLQAHGGEALGSARAVEEYLTALERKDRYLKDVWTTGVV
jgi:NADPH-ferrihemoprotein reductase